MWSVDRAGSSCLQCRRVASQSDNDETRWHRGNVTKAARKIEASLCPSQQRWISRKVAAGVGPVIRLAGREKGFPVTRVRPTTTILSFHCAMFPLPRPFSSIPRILIPNECHLAHLTIHLRGRRTNNSIAPVLFQRTPWSQRPPIVAWERGVARIGMTEMNGRKSSQKGRYQERICVSEKQGGPIETNYRCPSSNQVQSFRPRTTL